ncbi:uncharacterized protein LOC114361369 [Ostrinia furnacalis]|uniref:uncharacterized protein LOC114361369 n=1 Tax=Ostrinia furnacalis TaxID=93504 RepID=UPI00103CE8D7|nr:uncharacterized protein LOC114361369 [Ostrinia furnacalis]
MGGSDTAWRDFPSNKFASDCTYLIIIISDKQLNNCMETMGTTATIVLFFDELFDSVNGSPGGTKGKLRFAVKQNSPHEDFWRNSIQELRKIKFIDTKSKLSVQAGRPRHVRVPSLDGLFSKFGVEYFYPRYINQDPLENFFGRIRAVNYRNTNPDVNSFVYTFKSLVLSNMLSPHSKFSNCEEDNGDTLIDLNYLFTTHDFHDSQNIAPNVSITPLSSGSSGTVISTESVINEKVRVQISVYTAGYICRKFTKIYNCSICAKSYVTKEIQGIHKYIQYREYKRLKNNNLAYPNDFFLRL